MRLSMQAALGLRAHSGWAALVAIAGPVNSPTILDRRRIEIADPDIPGSKQPFHAAEDWPLAKAEDDLNRCAQRTKHLARRALSAAVDNLKKSGYKIVGCGILMASGRPLPALAEILASHALIHTAEGEFFRGALVDASEHCKVRATRTKEKELLAQGAENLRKHPAQLQRYVNELGRPVGPPWGQDEKYAALLGWLVLAATAKRRGQC